MFTNNYITILCMYVCVYVQNWLSPILSYEHGLFSIVKVWDLEIACIGNISYNLKLGILINIFFAFEKRLYISNTVGPPEWYNAFSWVE